MTTQRSCISLNLLPPNSHRPRLSNIRSLPSSCLPSWPNRRLVLVAEAPQFSLSFRDHIEPHLENTSKARSEIGACNNRDATIRSKNYMKISLLKSVGRFLRFIDE